LLFVVVAPPAPTVVQVEKMRPSARHFWATASSACAGSRADMEKPGRNLRGDVGSTDPKHAQATTDRSHDCYA
jgi:hypothetical protein